MSTECVRSAMYISVRHISKSITQRIMTVVMMKMSSREFPKKYLLVLSQARY